MVARVIERGGLKMSNPKFEFCINDHFPPDTLQGAPIPGQSRKFLGIQRIP